MYKEFPFQDFFILIKEVVFLPTFCYSWQTYLTAILQDYLKGMLGACWGNAESIKPEFKVIEIIRSFCLKRLFLVEQNSRESSYACIIQNYISH